MSAVEAKHAPPPVHGQATRSLCPDSTTPNQTYTAHEGFLLSDKYVFDHRVCSGVKVGQLCRELSHEIRLVPVRDAPRHASHGGVMSAYSGVRLRRVLASSRKRFLCSNARIGRSPELTIMHHITTCTLRAASVRQQLWPHDRGRGRLAYEGNVTRTHAHQSSRAWPLSTGVRVRSVHLCSYRC